MLTEEQLTIQAGDSVYHEPTKETWRVLGVNYQRDEVCVAGHPHTIGKLSDCKLIERGIGITASEMAHRIRAFGHSWEPANVLAGPG